MSRFQSLCEKRFHLAQNQTNLHTEVLAGLTTFATMSYVLATIPNMLSNAGLPKGAVLTALILLVMSCSIAMAVYTNRPFCLAPGMSSVAILSAVDTTGMTLHTSAELLGQRMSTEEPWMYLRAIGGVDLGIKGGLR